MMVKKWFFTVLSCLPLVLGVIFTSKFPVYNNLVTLDRANNSIVCVKKDIFGLHKTTRTYALSPYEKALMADFSASIVPMDYNNSYPIPLVDGWRQKRDILNGYVNRINDFFNSDRVALTLVIPMHDPSFQMLTILFNIGIIAIFAAISLVLILFIWKGSEPISKFISSCGNQGTKY